MIIIKSIAKRILPEPIYRVVHSALVPVKRLITVEMFVFLRAKNALPFSKYRNLKKYRDIHKGKRCFIVATGPSLTIGDVEKLKDEITFSMNSIVLSFADTSWRPTYYAIQDSVACSVLKKTGRFDLSGISGVFISTRIEKAIKAAGEAFICGYNVFLNDSYRQFIVEVEDSRKYVASPYKIKFSGNVYAAAYGSNIAYSVLQMAVFMGFSEIYLLGCDCHFETGKQLHIVDYGDGDDDEAVRKKLDPLRLAVVAENLLLAYRSAKEYADAHGVKIYNATRGGALEVFERVDLDEVLAPRMKNY